MEKIKSKDYLNERKYLTPARNKYAEGKKLGPLEKYNPNNPEHDNPKKYVYYSAGGSPFAHTMEALKASRTKDPLKNLAILLHDISKGTTFSDTTPGKLYTYYGHDKEAVKLIQTIADRLKMSNKERDLLLFTASNHMKFHKMRKMKPSKIFKIVNNKDWDALVAVAYADEFSRGTTFMSNKDFDGALKAAIKIKDKWGKKEVIRRLKLVDGNHVMKITGLSPGPKIGEIIRRTTNDILDLNIKDQKEIDKLIIKYSSE